MEKIKYLNVGCGNKYCENWFNLDMNSTSPHVSVANLLEGIPFPNDFFDVVYHSQVLEHFPKENAKKFISECFRVLKPNGILRVVVPDLENIVDEYKKHLVDCLENQNSISEANYDWIMLEMLDQTVRNFSGGQMAEYLKQPELINEKYILDRIGYVGRYLRDSLMNDDSREQVLKKDKSKFSFINLFSRKRKEEDKKEALNIGLFRKSGEVHMWLYDKFSLSRLLKESGFNDISIRSPFDSGIPRWNEYELDVKDNKVYDPTSLFMEARKIIIN